jgi:hypothetical protein
VVANDTKACDATQSVGELRRAAVGRSHINFPTPGF